MYIHKSDDIVNKYGNAYHRTIKMKPVDLKSSTYIESSKEINEKGPKFKIHDIVRISKYKNIFAKGYTPNWAEEVFVIKKVKNTVPWTYVINDFNGEEIFGRFYKKNHKKQMKKNLELKMYSREKAINYMLNGKDTIIRLIVGLIKKTWYK